MVKRTQIERYRAEKDRFLAQHPQSPLSPELKKKFTGLDYYPINEDLQFKVPLQKYDTIEEIEMQTSDGDVRTYLRIGYLEFEVDGQKAKIHVYQSADNPHHYFVPFRDKTSGNETYGAGRYLDLEEENGVFDLDFNMAYNPFCAYSDLYSCPLPPIENWLEVPIRAGEKAFPLKN